MKFEIFKSESGEKFYFRLKAKNGQVILTSQGYASKASAKNGIDSVKKHSASKDNFEIKESSDGKPYFNLCSSNKQVVGSSQRYSSDSSMKKGIDSVMTVAPEAEIVDLTLEG